MKKSISKKKIMIPILVIISLIIIALFAVFFIRRVNLQKNESFSRDYENGYEIVETMLSTDVSYYEMDKLEDYFANTSELEGIKKEYPEFYNYMEGMMAVAHGDKAAGNLLCESLAGFKVPYLEKYNDIKTKNYDNRMRESKAYSDLTRRVAARIYYELARICLDDGKTDEAYLYYDWMIKICDEEENVFDIIWLSTWAAYDLSSFQDGNDKAIDILLYAYEVAVEQDYYYQVDLLVSLAGAYNSSGNAVMFVVTSQKALEEAKKSNDAYSQIMINNSIGLEYLDGYSFDKAIRYFQDSYNIVLVDNSLETYAKTYTCSCLALAYIRTEDYEKATSFIEEADEYRKKQTDLKSANDDWANILTLKAEYEIVNGDAQKALEYLNESRDIFKSAITFSYTNFEYELDILYGRAYLCTGDGERAIYYFTKAKKCSDDIGSIQNGRYLAGLKDAYMLIGDVEKTFEYSELYEEYLLSKVYDSQKYQADMMMEEFQSNQKDDEILRLSTRTRLYTLIIIMSVILVFFTFFGAYGNYRHSKRIGVLNKELIELSERDGLTGIYNRRKLDEYLTENWDWMADKDSSIGVIMIDVDFFKSYNDYYGHSMGDNALMAVAGILQSVTSHELNTSSDSFAARYGGEEFILIFPKQTRSSMEMIINNIRIQLRNLNIEHEKSMVDELLTLSMGCVLIENDSENKPAINYEQAINLADEALYEAKKTRNTYCFKS